MIKRIRFRDMSSTLTYLAIGAIRIYDADGFMFVPGKVITNGLTVGEFDSASVAALTTYNNTPYFVANTFDLLKPQSSASGSYWLTGTKTGQWVEIIFKKAIKGISKIEFIPAVAADRGVNAIFYVDAYDINDQLLNSYQINPISTVGAIQTLITPELAMVGKCLIVDGGRLKTFKLPQINFSSNVAQGKTCTASSQYNASFVPANLLNNVLGAGSTGAGVCFAWLGTDPIGTAWVKVDFVASQNIGVVGFNFRYITTDTRFKDIRLDFSDGSSQTITLSEEWAYNSYNVIEYIRIVPVNTTYIKITPLNFYGTQGTYQCIGEFQAFPVVDVGTNGVIDLGAAPADPLTIPVATFTDNGITEESIPDSIINSLGSTFDILYNGPTSTYYPACVATCCPTDQIIKQTQDISLLGVQNIDSFAITNTALYGAYIKVALSFDSGITWQTHKNGSWQTVTLDAASIKINGMQPIELTTLTDWIPALATAKIRFAFLLGIENTKTDVCHIDGLESQWDNMGEWQYAINGTDYRVSFTDNNTLKVTFLVTGGYKVNY